MAYQRLDITDGKTTLIAAQVSHIEDGIIENESNIASNTEKISQNSDDISKNAEDIAKHAEEISTINSDLSQLLITETMTQGSITVPYNDYYDVTFDTTKSGYTFLGLVGWYFVNSSSGGVNSSTVVMNRQQFSGNNLIVRLRNYNNSSAAVIDCTVYLLYKKN